MALLTEIEEFDKQEKKDASVLLKVVRESLSGKHHDMATSIADRIYNRFYLRFKEIEKRRQEAIDNPDYPNK